LLVGAVGRAFTARQGSGGPATPARTPAAADPWRAWDERVDAEAVASWLVSQVPRLRYRGVVVGSPHGSASHLALALGMPWLPTGFELSAPPLDQLTGPSPAAACWAYGERLARTVVAENPGVVVRQVYDPVRRDATMYTTVRWHRVPKAYRDLMSEQLLPAAPVIVVRDVGRWPVVPVTGSYAFQLGSRASGLPPDVYYLRGDALRRNLRNASVDDETGAGDLPDPQDGDIAEGVDARLVNDLRGWATRDGRNVRQVIFRRPEVLSAAVADLYRAWLRASGRTGNRLIVECGRLVDPWQVVRAGLVPYWCAHPLEPAVQAIEWWLAGTEAFTSVDVLAEPPGTALPGTAQLTQWASIAAFATRRGTLDRRCARAYPLGAVPPEHASAVLRQHPHDLPYLTPIDADNALAWIASGANTSGLLVL
jgi:hypothetical protein